MHSSNEFRYLFEKSFAEERDKLDSTFFTPEHVRDNNTLLYQRIAEWCTRSRLRNLTEYLKGILEDHPYVKTLTTPQLQKYYSLRKEAVHTLALLSVFYDLVQNPPLSHACADARNRETVEPLAAVCELLAARAPTPCAVIYAPLEEVALYDSQALQRLRWKD